MTGIMSILCHSNILLFLIKYCHILHCLYFRRKTNVVVKCTNWWSVIEHLVYILIVQYWLVNLPLVHVSFFYVIEWVLLNVTGLMAIWNHIKYDNFLQGKGGFIWQWYVYFSFFFGLRYLVSLTRGM